MPTPVRSAAGIAPALRVLLISNMWPSTADPVFGTFVERQVAALRRAGASVRVVANSDARTGRLSLFAKYASLGARAAFAGLGRSHDVVVGHFLYPTADFAAIAATFSGRPLVLVAHGTDVTSVQRGGSIAAGCRGALPRAALVVCVSRALERRVRGELALPARVPTAVVHMGVDTALFRPDLSARQALGVAAPEKVVLFVGNLTEAKGVDVLMRAFADLRTGARADRLVLVGAGPAEAALRDASHALGVADRVTFTGRLGAADVARWMAAADVLVLPSRSEGLGLVLLEAMACGTPCVASEVGGIPEALDVPACGRLVAPDDAGALAAAVADVLSQGKEPFADACIARAADNSTDAMAAKFLAAVASAIGGR